MLTWILVLAVIVMFFIMIYGFIALLGGLITTFKNREKIAEQIKKNQEFEKRMLEEIEKGPKPLPLDKIPERQRTGLHKGEKVYWVEKNVSYEEEGESMDSGVFLITSLRLLFSGRERRISIPYFTIAEFEVNKSPGVVRIFVEGMEIPYEFSILYRKKIVGAFLNKLIPQKKKESYGGNSLPG